MRDDIRISQTADGSWLVDRIKTKTVGREYRMKVHAIAFGRALSSSEGVNLVIIGADGIGVLQPRHSLTYPTVLD